MRIYRAIPVILTFSNQEMCDLSKEDRISVEILKQFHDNIVKSASPRLVAADGNCCYRAASLALYGTESHHLFIRCVTALELLQYQATYNLESTEHHIDLFAAHISHSSWQNLFDDACKEGCYAQLPHIYAMSAAVDVVIQSHLPVITDAGMFDNYAAK